MPTVVKSAILATLTLVAGGERLAAADGDAAREALSRRPKYYPWYDAKTDTIRPIRIRQDREAADNRDSSWESSWKKKANNPPPVNRRFAGSSGFWESMQVVFWAVLAAALALLAVFLVWAFLRREDQDESATDSATPESADFEQLVENLPFQIKRPRSDLLGEAEHHYQAGNFDEAIVYLYSYQLVELDRNQLIHLTKGKTNRQYLRELWEHPELSRMLEETMLAFEDVFFGHYSLDRNRFEQCWNQLSSFREHLEPVPA